MTHGTGALESTYDLRDYWYEPTDKGAFDWEKGFDIEDKVGKIVVKDQNGSGSCGGQAWGYYGQVLDPDHEEKSARFIYSQTFAPGGGSAGRTNCELVISKGWGDEKLVSSYENNLPPSEEFMTKKEDIPPAAFTDALKDRGLSYANVVNSIEDIAIAIRENKGCIIGIAGKNNGTWRTKFPKPGISLVDSWNHWIYAGKAVTIGGKKYIGFINSWGEDVGDNGWQYVGEDYIKKDWVWSVWTMVYNFPLFKFTKLLKFGMINSEVKELQKRLGVIQTGFFGSLTKKAVTNYQLSHKLKGDGVVGPITRAILNKE